MKQRPSPVIGSFEDIGSDVVRETTVGAKDIGEKIMESLTGSTSSRQTPTTGKGDEVGHGTEKKPDGALRTMEETNDMNVKRAIARAALQELAGSHQESTPSVFEEKKQQELEQKQKQEAQTKQSSFAELPKGTYKRRRGDLYGIKGKSSTELSKNVRQD